MNGSKAALQSSEAGRVDAAVREMLPDNGQLRKKMKKLTLPERKVYHPPPLFLGVRRVFHCETSTLLLTTVRKCLGPEEISWSFWRRTYYKTNIKFKKESQYRKT